MHINIRMSRGKYRRQWQTSKAKIFIKLIEAVANLAKKFGLKKYRVKVLTGTRLSMLDIVDQKRAPTTSQK